MQQEERVLVCSPIFPCLQIMKELKSQWNVAGTYAQAKQFSRLWNILTGRENGNDVLGSVQSTEFRI